MAPDSQLQLIQEAMGASHVFCSAVSDLMERVLAEVTDHGLAMSQIELLLLVSRAEARFKVTDVADFLDITNAAASRAIDRLVRRGLIDRSISEEDRRAVDLTVTSEGQDLLDRFRARRDRHLEELLDGVSPDDLRAVASLLDRLSIRLLDPDELDEERCLRCGVHFRTSCVVKDVLGRECAVAGAVFPRVQ